MSSLDIKLAKALAQCESLKFDDHRQAIVRHLLNQGLLVRSTNSLTLICFNIISVCLSTTPSSLNKLLDIMMLLENKDATGWLEFQRLCESIPSEITKSTNSLPADFAPRLDLDILGKFDLVPQRRAFHSPFSSCHPNYAFIPYITSGDYSLIKTHVVPVLKTLFAGQRPNRKIKDVPQIYLTEHRLTQQSNYNWQAIEICANSPIDTWFNDGHEDMFVIIQNHDLFSPKQWKPVATSFINYIKAHLESKLKQKGRYVIVIWLNPRGTNHPIKGYTPIPPIGRVDDPNELEAWLTNSVQPYLDKTIPEHSDIFLNTIRKELNHPVLIVDEVYERMKKLFTIPSKRGM